MAILVLDLDLTAIVPLTLCHQVHQAQTLSLTTYQAKCHGKSISIKIINPIELADLIEYAYQHHDGVMILTSGRWDQSIRTVLANALNLSDTVRNKLVRCPIYTAITDGDRFSIKYIKLQHMDKHSRLELIRAHSPSLRYAEFVVLDDYIFHIYSFLNKDKFRTVWATTDTTDKAFYRDAKSMLQQFKFEKEVNEGECSPGNKRFGMFSSDEPTQQRNKRMRHQKVSVAAIPESTGDGVRQSPHQAMR
jgi:hypothetical protein